jgi:uncharacterized membrane protein (DUF373 family)
VDEAAQERGEPRGGIARPGSPPRPGGRGITVPIFVLEHAQDVVTVAVGLVLVILAAILLLSGIADFVHALMQTRILSAESIVAAATTLLDEVLLVLILVEVVHTVVLSLRSHRLVAQPFIIIGLVAVIRKILFVLSGEKLPGASVLALLIAMVAVFIFGLIAVNRFDRSEDPDAAQP